jgi:hypothetical protein
MKATVEKQKSKPFGRLTERQIKRRVGEAWALLENPKYSEKQVLLSAELLYYDTDKIKVLDEMGKYPKGHFAMFYYGTPDPNVIYLL